MIDLLLTKEFTYSAPAQGSYRSPVEMKDLTGDGREEAILFIRATTGTAADTRMAVFTPSEDGYTLLPEVTENAQSVHSIAFHDFNDDGRLEIAVGWRLQNSEDSSQYSLSVYTMTDSEMVEILSAPYAAYVVYDAEDGSPPALFIVKYAERGTERSGISELYLSRDGEMMPVATADLSRGVESFLRVRTTPLTDGKPGFLVASSFQTSVVNTREVTDVFTFRDDQLINVSRDMETGISGALVRDIRFTADDIDEDGVLDIPLPIPLNPHPDAGENAPVFYEIHWRAYSSDGASSEIARTYSNSNDGWFLNLPEKWPETDSYTVRRWESGNGNQKITTFSLLTPDRGAVNFLVLDYFSRPAGETPRSRGQTVLVDEPLLLVTCDLIPFLGEYSQYNLGEEEMKKIFKRIPIEWGGGV
jgi:hypothetical protein